MYLEKQVEKCLENPAYAFGILGSKGYGKSSIVKQTAERMGFKIVDIRLASSDETDLGGLPRIIEEGKCYDYIPPKWLHDLCEDVENKYLIILDEFNQAPPEVLNAIFPLLLASVNDNEVERHLAGLKIPSQTAVCLLGNEEQDNPFLTEIPQALYDRVFWLPFEEKMKHYEPYLKNKYGEMATHFFEQYDMGDRLNPRQIDRFFWVCEHQFIAASKAKVFFKKNFDEKINEISRELSIFYKNCKKKNFNTTSDKHVKFKMDKNNTDDDDFLENLN